MLGSLAVPASAQSTCQATPGVNTLMRADGYNDLTGEIVLTCTVGLPTAQSVLVPQVDILITMNTTITSRITAALTLSNTTEPLLLMDEPNGAKWNSVLGGHPIANCGLHGEDSSQSG